MTEENNIFPASGDVLVYLDRCTKNIPQHLFEAIHLVGTYLMTEFSSPYFE